MLEKLAYDIPALWNTELRAKRVDLGSSPGLVPEGTDLLCGGTGNCQIFVFRRVNNRWISLFKGQARICEAFTIRPGTTNGIKNLRARPIKAPRPHKGSHTNLRADFIGVSEVISALVWRIVDIHGT